MLGGPLRYPDPKGEGGGLFPSFKDSGFLGDRAPVSRATGREIEAAAW